jgi:putative transposase
MTSRPNFLTGVDHAGKAIRLDNPRWWQAEKERITELQQAVSRKKNRRSNRRRKAVRRLAAAHAKTARRRLDWAHQQTARLTGSTRWWPPRNCVSRA